MKAAIVGFVLLVQLAAPLSGQGQSGLSVSAIAGCYRLTLGVALPARRQPMRIPTDFRLDTVVADSEVGVGVHLWGEADDLAFPPEWRLAGDTVRVEFYSLSSGATLTLVRRHALLVGSLRYHTGDALKRKMGPTVSAVATRGKCTPRLERLAVLAHGPTVPPATLQLVADTLAAINPRFTGLHALDLSVTPGKLPRQKVLLVHADGYDAFAIVLMNDSLSRVISVLDMIPSPRGNDYTITIARTTRDSVILTGAGATYGDIAEEFLYAFTQAAAGSYPRSRLQDAQHGRDIRDLTARGGMGSLEAGVGPDSMEVREWTWLPGGRVYLNRFIRGDSGWRWQWIDSATDTRHWPKATVPWGDRGRILSLNFVPQLFTLPVTPARPRGYVVPPGSVVYVVEVADGPLYHVTSGAARNGKCSRADRTVLKKLNQLFNSGFECDVPKMTGGDL